MSKTYSLCAIGNSITDYNALVKDEFLSNRKIRKSSMQLVSSSYIDRILLDIKNVSDIIVTAGGSVANSSIVFSILSDIFSSNLKASFTGVCGNDSVGTDFISDMQSYGVSVDTVVQHSSIASSKCVCLAHFDGARSLLTYLGASLELKHSDIEHQIVIKSEYILLEGYILDCPIGGDIVKQISSKISSEISCSSSKLVFCLSDIGVVERHYDFISEYLRSGFCDILVCNLYELCSLLFLGNYLSSPDYSGNLAGLIDFCDRFKEDIELISNSGILKSWNNSNFDVGMLVVTCGSAGSIVLSDRVFPCDKEYFSSTYMVEKIIKSDDKSKSSYIYKCPSFKVKDVIDTTGAGDYFCGGFLFGLASGLSVLASLQLGNLCASCIIGERGTRSSCLSKNIKKFYCL